MKNWTPQALRCGFGSCQVVYELEDGRLLIVGTHVREIADATSAEPIEVAPTEAAVIIERAYFADLFRDEVERAVLAERERCLSILNREFGHLTEDQALTGPYFLRRASDALRSIPSEDDKP